MDAAPDAQALHNAAVATSATITDNS